MSLESRFSMCEEENIDGFEYSKGRNFIEKIIR